MKTERAQPDPVRREKRGGVEEEGMAGSAVNDKNRKGISLYLVFLPWPHSSASNNEVQFVSPQYTGFFSEGLIQNNPSCVLVGIENNQKKTKQKTPRKFQKQKKKNQ